MDDEYPELMEAYKKEPTKKVAERILGVVHVLVDKMSIAEVARLHRKAYNTIKNHCDRVTVHGLELPWRVNSHVEEGQGGCRCAAI